jgi:hypothetical protein
MTQSLTEILEELYNKAIQYACNRKWGEVNIEYADMLNRICSLLAGKLSREKINKPMSRWGRRKLNEVHAHKGQ